MDLFNREAAVAYAYKYALNANGEFPNLAFSNGDCTNFVSQAMLAGGWPMIRGASFDKLAWFSHSGEERNPGLYDNHIRPYFSDSWATASVFAEFMEKSGRGSICTRDELEQGDVVSIADFGKKIHHNMIVTKILSGFDGNEIYVSYHSKFKLNEPLDKIEAAYQDSWSFYWKISLIIGPFPPPPTFPEKERVWKGRTQ